MWLERHLSQAHVTQCDILPNLGCTTTSIIICSLYGFRCSSSRGSFSTHFHPCSLKIICWPNFWGQNHNIHDFRDSARANLFLRSQTPCFCIQNHFPTNCDVTKIRQTWRANFVVFACPWLYANAVNSCVWPSLKGICHSWEWWRV